MKLLCAAISILAAATPVLAQDVTKASLLFCDTDLCGGYAANNATLNLTAGSVSVSADGQVTVNIDGLRDRLTNLAKPRLGLQLFFGVFADNVWKGISIGPFQTDANASVHQVVGVMPPGNQSGSFVINDAARSQFISGFATGAPVQYAPVPPIQPDEPLYQYKSDVTQVGLVPSLSNTCVAKPGNPYPMPSKASPATGTFLKLGKSVTIDCVPGV